MEDKTIFIFNGIRYEYIGETKDKNGNIIIYSDPFVSCTTAH